MATLIESQLADAVAYMKGLRATIEALPDDPKWGEGVRLWLPSVIPLRTDYSGEENPVAWLVANDFDGYDLTTEKPTRGVRHE